MALRAFFLIAFFLLSKSLAHYIGIGLPVE